MIKILPISEPIVRCYPYPAHICTVIGAKSKFYIPWVYNYFVQLFTAKDFQNEKRVDYITPDLYKFVPGLVTHLVDRPIASEAWNGILGFIKSHIDYGYYIYGLYDVSQIAAYGVEKFWVHDPMIYGYNDEKEEVYFVDNYKYGKYSLGIAGYDEIVSATAKLNSIENLAEVDWLPGFRCIKYNDKAEPFQFNKSIYVGQLSDYLNQQDSRYRWMQPWEIIKEWDHRRWGIGVYSVMQEYLLYSKENHRSLDKRGFFVQMEHKQLLEKTITYLLGESWKTMYSLEWQLLEKDIKLATIMMNLCLKYNFTLDGKLIDLIRSYLVDLEDNDRQLFPCLINLVSNYVPDKKYISVPGETIYEP